MNVLYKHKRIHDIISKLSKETWWNFPWHPFNFSIYIFIIVESVYSLRGTHSYYPCHIIWNHAYWNVVQTFQFLNYRLPCAWCFVRRLVGQLKRRRQRSTMEEMIITNILSDPIIYRCRSCVGNCGCAAMRSDLICMRRAY